MTDVAAIQEQAAGAADALIKQLAPALPDVRARIADFIRACEPLGPLDHYKVFPAPAQAIVAAVAQTHDSATLRRFLRAVLASAVLQTVNGARFRALPPRTAANQARHLLRIAQDADAQAPWLALDQDLFQKEFGLATLRLYAAGSQLVDYRCGVPRSTVLAEGMARALPKLLTMVKLGGFRPYFQIHTHKFNLDAFHEAGWEECYLCCAELYAVHPEVLGMYGSSWFYDPALATISPRLAYLRDTPGNNGAALMFVVKGGDAINNATATSASRRQLYEEGKYAPTNYMLVWGRDAQRAWAARRLAAQAG
ncbi:hypothetical protein [Massilia sp. TSP1-1-2]|uniref:hypothetical protein n=1 Tax=Massilia sp. TSP1-1-2 TaxID=2804649 RepID=UPI003CF8B97D